MGPPRSWLRSRISSCCCGLHPPKNATNTFFPRVCTECVYTVRPPAAKFCRLPLLAMSVPWNAHTHTGPFFARAWGNEASQSMNTFSWRCFLLLLLSAYCHHHFVFCQMTEISSERFFPVFPQIFPQFDDSLPRMDFFSLFRKKYTEKIFHDRFLSPQNISVDFYVWTLMLLHDKGVRPLNRQKKKCQKVFLVSFSPRYWHAIICTIQWFRRGKW